MRHKGTSRKNKTAQGAHSYKVGRYDVQQMADGRWYLFLDGGDTGRDYGTLKKARQAITDEEQTVDKDKLINVESAEEWRACKRTRHSTTNRQGGSWTSKTTNKSR